MQAMAAATCFAADSQTTSVRGKLIVREGNPSAVETPEHQTIELDGDEPTKKVLGDARLNGFEIQAQGKFSTPVRFSLSLAHLRPLLVRDKGQWKLVTYWCEICSIRAFTPGPCACCQRNTELDLRDPEHPDQA
jgi:hypothetical protein